jgi:3-oxoadipate enol-lactonase
MAGMTVEKAGEGPAVVMVHGLGATGNAWQPQVAALSRRFTLYRPDLPGQGRSPLEAGVSVASIVTGLVRLLDENKIDKARFVGHSFGTLVLQHLAAAHPQRVEKLVLVGAVRAPAEANRQGPRDRANKVRAEGMASIADAVANFATAPATREHKPAVIALVREFLMRQDPEGYARTCEALASATDANLSAISAPTLFITGADDAVGPPAMVQKLAAEFRNGRFEQLAECGHWPTIEQPERVTALLDQFL